MTLLRSQRRSVAELGTEPSSPTSQPNAGVARLQYMHHKQHRQLLLCGLWVEVSGVIAKSQIYSSLALQLPLNSRLWILVWHTKLQWLWGQGRVNLALGRDLSFAALFCPSSAALGYRLRNSVSILVPQGTSPIRCAFGGAGIRVALGEGLGHNFHKG